MNDTKKHKITDNVDHSFKNKKKKSGLSEESSLYKSFITYQTELDKRNDKHERLVKLSRDVTIQSKRAIFSLLRKSEDREKIVSEGRNKISEIKILLESMNQELQNEDIYRFHRAFSPGIQEFVEAISLLYYLEKSSVISYEEVAEIYFDFGEDSTNFLTPIDYMLGIADLTGELMRMAINAIGNGEFDLVGEICSTLQEIHSNFSSFSSNQRELSRKLNVMKNSLRKVESAYYNLKIRGSELPMHLLTNLFIEKEDTDNQE